MEVVEEVVVVAVAVRGSGGGGGGCRRHSDGDAAAAAAAERIPSRSDSEYHSWLLLSCKGEGAQRPRVF